MFEEFERRTNAMAEDGQPLTADALSAVYYELNQQYFGEDMVSDPLIAYEWCRIPHFYYNFYVYQYATGFTSAVAIAHAILNEGASAVERYKKFLSGGCSDAPVELLKIAGVNLETPAPIQSALDVMDEISASDKTAVCELKDGETRTYEISPEDFGMDISSKEDLVGGDAKENAEITLAVLNGEKGPRRNAVLLNSAAGLFVAGKVDSLEEGISLAEEVIDSGKALNQLERFIEVTNR
jgi:hypothetical protein